MPGICYLLRSAAFLSRSTRVSFAVTSDVNYFVHATRPFVMEDNTPDNQSMWNLDVTTEHANERLNITMHRQMKPCM